MLHSDIKMTQPLLEKIIGDFEELPVSWSSFDYENFSKDKRLWEYQQNSLRSATKALWKYYEDLSDFHRNEDETTNTRRKEKLYQLYRDNELPAGLDYKLDKKSSKVLADYYDVVDDKVAFENFINRMSFWMATGSGKTLVIVKLIQLLHVLVERHEIPKNDILVLAHRDELLEQFRSHITEFNNGNFGLHIRLHNLKDYANVKRSNPTLFSGDELTVFTYRSDNLSLEQKDKIIDFRNYDANGNWYVLLDEAHKGDKEDSKRQNIFSILSRNGFLFNFSATFTDPRDILTTVSNFNLAEFVSKGFGKHISILKQEMRAFKDKEDYNGDEKQKIVLQSLLALAYIGKQGVAVKQIQTDLYHKPLLLTLVNSVNTEDADLKLFFRELERIANGDVSDEVFQAAKDALWTEVEHGVPLIFESDEAVHIKQKQFEQLNLSDIWQYVFNSPSPGSIEVLRRPSDKQELAFKIQTADKPFALIKIGNISEWLKASLVGYEINETFDDEGYFYRLNDSDSDIKILLGSRSFYEGWDSNRPNVINFVNIGTNTDSRKFALQAIGRGVRIEPLKNKKKRLRQLANAKQVDLSLFQKVQPFAPVLETLFIFGTNREALQKVIEDLNKEKAASGQVIKLDRNTDLEISPLLIPTYKSSGKPIIQQINPKKFEIDKSELKQLQKYIEFVDNDEILLVRHRTLPADFASLKKTLGKTKDFFATGGRRFASLPLLWQKLIDYFNVIPEEFDSFKELASEISHFERITVALDDVSELEKQINKVKNFQTGKEDEARLEALLTSGKITPKEYAAKLKAVVKSSDEKSSFTHNGQKLNIEFFADHYYIPLLISDKEKKVEYIKHIVKVPSEISFLQNVSTYLTEQNNLTGFDWAFSKLDETVDNVTIPYFDREQNTVRAFNADFIFWLKKLNDYLIVFIDPKGKENISGYAYKWDGYKELFTVDGKPKVFQSNGLNVRVFVFFYTQDTNVLTTEQPGIWVDSFGKAVDEIAACLTTETETEL